MGEFSLSGNTNIGLSAVEISVNPPKTSQNTIFYSSTTPTTASSNGTELIIQAKSYSAIMQDDSADKAVAAVSGPNGDDLSITVSSVVGSAITTTVTTSADKNATSSLSAKDNDVSSNTSVNDISEKLNEQVVSAPNKSVSSLPPFFHPAEPATPAGALWSTAIEDGFVPNLAGVNGMGFQNFPSPNQQQQLFSNNLSQNQVNQTRRAITASHNFPPQMGRQQSLSNHPLYAKGYGSWNNPPPGPPGQSWSPTANTTGNTSAWNRGRSVPNLTPLQQMGVGMATGRKPSPTFNQQQVISPVKFRRSTSYPGKGPFPQPPTFEITNMDEARELLPFQDRCGVVSANGSSPLENMRGFEHYLNDIMSPQSNSTDLKGFINTNAFQSLQLHGKSSYFPGLDDQAGPVLLEEPTHLVDGTLGTQPLSSPSRSSPHSQGSEGGERFSRKVFVGGLPPDIDEDEITVSFRRFGPLVVDWPHKAESKSYFPPKGYAFLLFQDENSVQSLIDACITDEDKLYLCVSSPTIKDKPVQIRPWRLSDADFVLDASMPLDPRKTVFVGGVPRPLKAVELAMIMDRLYGGVCYAGIDTDPELKYPKGAGRVAFSNQQSYIAAISARFVQLQHGDIDKRVEVKPYVLDDQMCDECQGQRCGGKFAPFFCANVTCLQYYCEHCWATIHSRPGREFHKPLVKEGADRPRAVPFRWC
ncbi:cytoplasmic polyadenylation element-binding protein 2 [Cylas formicarius]|uniref:cytoplasmic polyadenylation element-binding protein 2 n=1 Tax=Cylas formicarius TaxID=197179 RepID=UPI0029584495|nr:cytoplasmic polyadenylation element-binding protein 2 [Cylas formicarius]XP_060516374.1 cytoplasmic polyadenylation element-binding protein 2 [Cylas formicarius]XP_060516375.1 cytoplasmic polyadenylation element-binding protein 2 [Cylas formicarius]